MKLKSDTGGRKTHVPTEVKRPPLSYFYFIYRDMDTQPTPQTEMSETVFTRIHHPTRKKLRLSILEYCVMDSIASFTRYSSTKYFHTFEENIDNLALGFDMDQRAIVTAIEKLVREGLLEVSASKEKVRPTFRWVIAMKDATRLMIDHRTTS